MEELLKSARQTELKTQELAKRAEDEANRARKKEKEEEGDYLEELCMR